MAMITAATIPAATTTHAATIAIIIGVLLSFSCSETDTFEVFIGSFVAFEVTFVGSVVEVSVFCQESQLQESRLH